jgi:hypothetical protein
MTRRRLVIASATLCLTAHSFQTQAAPIACEKLANASLPQATITAAQEIWCPRVHTAGWWPTGESSNGLPRRADGLSADSHRGLAAKRHVERAVPWRRRWRIRRASLVRRPRRGYPAWLRDREHGYGPPCLHRRLVRLEPGRDAQHAIDRRLCRAVAARTGDQSQGARQGVRRDVAQVLVLEWRWPHATPATASLTGSSTIRGSAPTTQPCSSAGPAMMPQAA